MQQKPNVMQVIVETTMVLHNLMRSRYPVHHEILMDREDDNGQVTPGAWRQNANMHDMEQVRGNLFFLAIINGRGMGFFFLFKWKLIMYLLCNLTLTFTHKKK